MSTKKYCVIGDLHGRIDTLDKILAKSKGYHYIFLGDTIHHKAFFKRTKRSSPIKMLYKVRELVESGLATLIIGNNENYILQNLILPKSNIKHKETKYTMECLRDMEISKRLDLIRWLSTSPLLLEFESYGKNYRCAHAYYSPEYAETSRNKVLTGLGYPWFRTDELDQHLDPNIEYILGHYGYPYFRKNLKVIDATNFEGVGVYYTDREEFFIYY